MGVVAMVVAGKGVVMVVAKTEGADREVVMVVVMVAVETEGMRREVERVVAAKSELRAGVERVV